VLIHDYLDAAGHGTDENGALFRPVRNNSTGDLDNAITADGVYKLVRAYSAQLGCGSPPGQPKSHGRPEAVASSRPNDRVVS
jgi:hypothetical protein